MSFRKLIFVFMCGTSILGTPGQVAGQEQAAKLDFVVRTYRAPQNKIVFKVSFKYDFKRREQIYIDGIGAAPAKGAFTYFTNDSDVVFKDSAQGRRLALISLMGPEVYTSASFGPDFPDESQLSSVYRSGKWSYASSFTATANRIINQFFPSGYRAYETNDISHYQTTYASLRGLPANLIGQVSVLLSHPYDAKSGEFDYHIQFVVREKRVQSGKWRYELSQETNAAAELFLNNLVGKFDEEGRSHK